MANSLAEFYQSLRDRNASRSLYAPVAQSVLQANVTDPYGSMGSNFANNLAKGLLAGGAGALFRNEQAQYDQDLTAGLRATLGGASAFNQGSLADDDLSAISAFKLARDVEQADTIRKLQQDIAVSGLKAESEEGGKLRGQLGAVKGLGSLGTGIAEEDLAKVNPIIGAQVDAKNKKLADLDSLRKEFNALQPVKDFTQVSKAANALSGALKDKGKVADQELVRYSIQMIEPGMAVREGEQAAVANSQSLPDAWKGELAGALSGKSKLSDEVRQGIARLGSRAYDATKLGYGKALEYYDPLAKQRGLGADQSISFLGQAPEASAVFGNIPQLGTGTGAALKASDLIAKGYTKGANGWIPPASSGGIPRG